MPGVSGSLESVTLAYGGHSRAELLTMLSAAGVRLNAHAQTLLSDLAFDEPERSMRLALRSVADLGLAEGGTLSDVFEAGRDQGLQLVPLIAAPYVRLALEAQEQAPDSELSQGRAPTGSIHIASKPVSADAEYPKGFYLRVVDGEPWLRGYRCDERYVFEPGNQFLLGCG